jgi:hypothetical protein
MFHRPLILAGGLLALAMLVGAPTQSHARPNNLAIAKQMKNAPGRVHVAFRYGPRYGRYRPGYHRGFHYRPYSGLRYGTRYGFYYGPRIGYYGGYPYYGGYTYPHYGGYSYPYYYGGYGYPYYTGGIYFGF